MYLFFFVGKIIFLIATQVIGEAQLQQEILVGPIILFFWNYREFNFLKKFIFPTRLKTFWFFIIIFDSILITENLTIQNINMNIKIFEKNLNNILIPLT